MFPRGAIVAACAICLGSSEACGTERAIIEVPHALYRIALSPSGALVAGSVGRRKDAVFVWDSTNGKVKAVLEGHLNVVMLMSFSNDEKTLTTFCTNNAKPPLGIAVKQWNLETGKEVESFILTDGGTNHAISHDGAVLVTTRFPDINTAIVVDVNKKTVITKLKVDSRGVNSAAVDRTGKWVVTGGSGGDIIVWELLSGKRIKKIDASKVYGSQNPSVYFVDFSPDGKLIASYHAGFRNCLWSVEEGKQLGKPFKTEGIQSRFTADGKILVTGHDKFIEFRSVKTQEVLWKQLSADADSELMLMNRMAISQDGRTVAISTTTTSIHIWTIPEFQTK